MLAPMGARDSLVGLLLGAACQPAVTADRGGNAVSRVEPPTATDPSSGVPSMSHTIVRGRIEAIRLYNINKAQGHHTYNVELTVRGSLEGAWGFNAARPEVVNVRVAKIYFDDLDDASRAALAPDGPKAELAPAHFENWAVGDEVSLIVEMTSPGLGALIRPSS